MTAIQTVSITPKGASRTAARHLWVYRSDLHNPPPLEGGEVVRVIDRHRNFIGMALYSSRSQIALRFVSFHDEPIDRDFWHRRLRAAIEYRRQVVKDSDAFRLVYSEGDLLSSLIIDRYSDCVVLQTLSQGMDRLKSMWVELLVEELNPRAIIERNDAKVRNLEGLPMQSGILHGEPPSELIVSENGIRFAVDILSGQKTGAFLDQRENRLLTRDFAKGRALDCFSFHGSFAMNLAAKADSVMSVDISGAALERARQNAALNELSNIEFAEANAFDLLSSLDDNGERFDTIVLDPPAFAKHRSALESGLRGYKEINLRAFRLLNPGGVLISCSCSYHVDEALFLGMLAQAAADSHRDVQLIEKRTQAKDHPILLSVPETYYLKCIFLRIVN
ncbi:MAG TPA: class I SAM-dependent rRNA methyltransferase [Blastocatellia bacterium]|nr:class I SAM-dependent rRNA methyltransferase [Blastocatellia bacterium]